MKAVIASLLALFAGTAAFAGETVGYKVDGAKVYSGAPHAFTVFGAPVYREHADKKSWSAFQDFLKPNLGG